MRRRTYLTSASVGLLGLAGCVGASRPAGDGTETPPPDSEDRRLAEWTRSTNCGGMDDSVIKVEWTTSNLSQNYEPIAYSTLTDGERRILRTVVREGGYGTCEVSDAFRRFVQRVGDHRERQERDVVALEYDGRYYGLYVEKQDQVYSMN